MVRHALRVLSALLQNVFFSSETRLLVDRTARAAISPTGRNSPSRSMGKSVGEASYDRPDIRAYVRFKDEFDAPWTSGRLRELEARVGIEQLPPNRATIRRGDGIGDYLRIESVLDYSIAEHHRRVAGALR